LLVLGVIDLDHDDLLWHMRLCHAEQLAKIRDWRKKSILAVTIDGKVFSVHGNGGGARFDEVVDVWWVAVASARS